MSLDYSTLDQPITSADIDIYKSVYGEGRFVIPKAVRTGSIALLVVMLVIGIALILTGNGEDTMIFVQAIIVIIILIAFADASQNKIKRRAKTYKFALANNAQLLVDIQEPQYDGAIFDHGHSRSITEAIVLPDATEIGNYTYTTGSGKNRSEHHWGYTRVKLSRRLPHMLLDAKSNNIFGKISNLPQSFASQTLSLEGDFDKYFTLHVPENYQRDALYVLTPDVMAALIDAGQKYDIEIIDDYLYIYGPALNLTLRSSIERLMTVIDKIGTELRDQTEHYSDERAPSPVANIIAEPGRRLKKNLGIGQILTIIFVVIGFLWIIMSANASFFGM